MNIWALNESIKKNGAYTSYHEVFKKQCKLVFDIDGTESLNIAEFVEYVYKIIRRQPKYHVASSTKYENEIIVKYSYHIIFDVVYSIHIMRLIADIIF